MSYIQFINESTYRLLSNEDLVNYEVWKAGKIYQLGPEQRLELTIKSVPAKRG